MVVEFVPIISRKFRVPMEPKPRLKFVENRLVELAVVLKRDVVVAEVPVADEKVKFCRVLDPVRRSDPVVKFPVVVILPEPVLIELLLVNMPFVQLPAISKAVVPVPVLFK